MVFEGELSDIAVPEIFHTIAGQQKTGILTIQGKDDIVAVSFLQGKIVAADSLNQTIEEGLETILIQKGLVGAAELESLARNHQERAGRLVDLLVEKEVLTRQQVMETLREQTFQLLGNLLSWSAGRFKFYGGSEVSYEEGFEAISVEELVVGAAKEREQGEGTDSDLPVLGAVFEPGPGSGPHGIVPSDQEGSASGTGGVEERLVVEQLDGRRSLAQVAARLDLGEYQVLLAAARLRRQGRIRMRTAEEIAAEAAAAQAKLEVPSAEVREPELVRPVAARRPAVVREVPSDKPLRWAAAAVAVLLAALSLWGFASATSRVVLPFPWQESLRSAFERAERELLYLRIDRAARTYFLVMGGYPDRLETLVSARLLSPADLYDPAGRPLAYFPRDLGYEIQPIAGGEGLAHLGTREAITGDFLLDFDFLSVPEPAEVLPLVLLD